MKHSMRERSLFPLLIQDRNLGVGTNGKLDGTLVHKVEDADVVAPLQAGPMEFFGPYTLVGSVQRMGGSCRVGRRLVLVGVCPKPVAQP